MIDPGAVIIAIVAWVVVRAGIRRWIAWRYETESISTREAAIAYTVALAIAPFFLLPWLHSPTDILVLSFAAVAIYLGKYAFIRYSLES